MNNYTNYLKKYSPNVETIFSKKVLDLLNTLYEVLSEREEKIYLVGGIVRDLFIGRNTQDIDLVTDGLPNEIGEILLPYVKVSHQRFVEKFMTYNIFTKNRANIDIAKLRLETYEKPGALPKVLAAKNIEEDSVRRDFTINAIYLSFDEKAKIYDPFNGLDDIKNRKIRILHNNSFCDDPTRIFRAIKFAGRYNFEIEENTSLLLKEAVASGHLSLISTVRLKNEIYNIFDEKKLYHMLILMDEFGIFDFLNINLPKREELLKVVKFINSSFFEKYRVKNKISKNVFLLVYLSKNMGYDERVEFLKSFEIGQKQINKILFTDEEFQEKFHLIKAAKKDYDIYFALNNLNSFKILYLLCYFKELNISQEKQKIERYIYDLSHIEILVKGRDLIEIGITDKENIQKYIKEGIKYQLDMKSPTKEKIMSKILEK